MQSILQDLRFGARALGRNKASRAIAVLTLALGLARIPRFFGCERGTAGVCAYKDPGKLVFVWSTMISQGVPISGSAAPDFREWRTRNHVFEGMVAYTYETATLRFPAKTFARAGSRGFTRDVFAFRACVRSWAARFFRRRAMGPPPLCPPELQFLANTFWRPQNVLGRNLHMGSAEYAIVGVMPKGMPFFDDLPRVDLWLRFPRTQRRHEHPRNHYVNVVARLKRGVRIERATTEWPRSRNRSSSNSRRTKASAPE